MRRATAASRELPRKTCASQATYDLIKRELFRRAAQLRGSDQAALRQAFGGRRDPDGKSGHGERGRHHGRDQLLGLAVARPAARRCRGRRPPEPDVRRRLHGSACRRRQRQRRPAAQCRRDHRAAGDAGAGRARPSSPRRRPVAGEIAPGAPSDAAPFRPEPAAQSPPPPASASTARPSFDCAKRTDQRRDRRLLRQRASPRSTSTWPRNIAARSAGASPQEQAILQSTRDRFLAYRDRCPNRQCIGDAYVGRMREIRDIMEGRWSPAR